MRIDRVLNILSALKHFDALGETATGLNIASVAFWSSVPRSTCYRYLKKLEAVGAVIGEIETYRGKDATMWYITQVGRDFFTLGHFGEKQ